jgi:hypothetical protein
MDTLKLPRNLPFFCNKLAFYDHFKAADWKYFTLYLAIPLFHNTGTPNNYFKLWLQFIELNILLCTFQLKREKLGHIQNVADKFVKDFESLFGEEAMTINMHLQTHIPKDIERLGLAFCHSEWWGETKLGDVKRDFHGTQVYPRELLVSYVDGLHKEDYFESPHPHQAGKKLWKNYFTSEHPEILEQTKLSNLSQSLMTYGVIQHNLTAASMVTFLRCGEFSYETQNRASRFSCDDSGCLWSEDGNKHFGIIAGMFVIHKSNGESSLIFHVHRFISEISENLLHFRVFLSNRFVSTYLDLSKIKIRKVFTCKVKNFRYFGLMHEQIIIQ